MENKIKQREYILTYTPFKNHIFVNYILQKTDFHAHYAKSLNSGLNVYVDINLRFLQGHMHKNQCFFFLPLGHCKTKS